jgi:hypothetical protein
MRRRARVDGAQRGRRESRSRQDERGTVELRPRKATMLFAIEPP